MLVFRTRKNKRFRGRKKLDRKIGGVLFFAVIGTGFFGRGNCNCGQGERFQERNRFDNLQWHTFEQVVVKPGIQTQYYTVEEVENNIQIHFLYIFDLYLQSVILPCHTIEHYEFTKSPVVEEIRSQTSPILSAAYSYQTTKLQFCTSI